MTRPASLSYLFHVAKRFFPQKSFFHVKFDEETKYELKIGLLCEGKPENAENCRKIIKLLVEKNHVEKYRVHDLRFERASKKATFGASRGKEGV